MIIEFANALATSFTKRPSKTNGRLANRGLTSLVKEAADFHVSSTCKNEDKKYRLVLILQSSMNDTYVY